MRHQIRAIVGGLALALLLAGTLVNASPLPQYAITASTGDIYVMDYSKPGTATNATGSLPYGISFGGVAVYDDYVFAAGSINGAGKLFTGQIDSKGVITWGANPIALNSAVGNMSKPGAVAVDSTGGVYVISNSQSTTRGLLAYLPSSGGTWSSAGLNIVNSPTAYFMDIAATGTGSQAITAQRDSQDPVHHWAGQSWVSAIAGGNVSKTVLPDQSGYFPQGIAAGTGGLSYMVNYSTDLLGGNGSEEKGSISVIDSANLSSAGNAKDYLTGAFRPTDVAFFTNGGVSYLGLVGINAGIIEAKRIELDVNGLPVMQSVVTKQLGTSTTAYCAVSKDGLFWVSTNSSSGGTVTAIDTANWTAEAKSWSVVGQPGYIATYTVPEPGSLLVLLTGTIGLIGRLKRRRR